MYALFSSINANAFWNHMVAYVMPGEGIEVGPPMTVAEAEKKRPPSFVEIARTRERPLTGFGTTLAEARTLISYLALTGVAYPLASVLPELPEERVALLKSTLPTLPILPVDLFSRGTDMQWDRFTDTRPDDYIHNYPEILDLKVSARSGTYDVVGVTNWRGERATRELSFADQLGLPGGARYVVFDYWERRLLGVFTGTLRLDVEPHDTRVVLVHPLLPRPQLVGDLPAHHRRPLHPGPRVGRLEPHPARLVPGGAGRGLRPLRTRPRGNGGLPGAGDRRGEPRRPGAAGALRPVAEGQLPGTAGGRGVAARVHTLR